MNKGSSILPVITFKNVFISHVPNDLEGGKTSYLYFEGFKKSGYTKCNINIEISSESFFYSSKILATGTYTFEISDSDVLYGTAGYCSNANAVANITLYN